MYDPNLVDFYSRVAAHQKSFANGLGHESPGTLSRSVTYGRQKTRRRLRVTPFIIVALAAFGLKGAILHSVGAAAYEARVERLNAGEGFDRVGGWLMQIDPVTAFVAGKIAEGTVALQSWSDV